MTCVLASPWNPFSDSSPWSQMNPDGTSGYDSLERQSSHGYASSGSESRKPTSSSGKKRASRAGTRSVTTLSAAQLERKRANDREAQRAIRQRTKDHIDTLEKSINELRGSQESHEQLVAVTQQRNRELEEENAYLRSRLNEAGYAVPLPPSDNRPPDSALLSVQSTSPATQPSVAGSSIQRPGSTPRSASVTTSQSSSSRHGSIQQQAGYAPGGPNVGMSIANSGLAPVTSTLSTWRSHDSMQGVPSGPPPPVRQVPDTLRLPQPGGYTQGPPQDQRVEWASTAPSYPYAASQDQKYAVPPPQHTQHQQYAQTPVQNYAPAPAPPPPQQTYHPPQLPPQAEFQGMSVSSPAAPYQQQQQPQQTYQQPQPVPHQQPPQGSYHHQQTQPQPHPAPPPQTSYQQHPQQGYTQPPSFQMTPMQGSAAPTEYGQMQPPPVPTSTYHAPPSEQSYAPQQMQPPMQYQEDMSGRPYNMAPHYPPG